ncbi:unnamed protein product [Parascedosporium putredinis]|uniref:Uncharacterized protein n=1 Tax=Parascedosporium putredinis TaxID=1442378 RepID=A0A9P1H8G3_9PEZI|nr:unnamed protein product [Parascedosporium putredinis]CAI7999805.1 unnamed protein product [Parascedosporium putredinis]
MAQVQAALSGKFSYDWIFFSSEEPGDDFKETTSTLAGEATAFYEYLPKDHPIFAAQPYGPLDMSEDDSRAYAPSAALLGPFPLCNESRSGMSKAPVPSSLDFDIFKALDDHGMVYGYSQPNSLAPPVTSNTALYHPYLNDHFGVGSVSWTAEEIPANGLDSIDGNIDGASLTSNQKIVRRKAIGSTGTLQADALELTDGNEHDEHDERLLSPSRIIQALSAPGSNYEIGWLGAFRQDDYKGITWTIDRMHSDDASKALAALDSPPANVDGEDQLQVYPITTGRTSLLDDKEDTVALWPHGLFIHIFEDGPVEVPLGMAAYMYG